MRRFFLAQEVFSGDTDLLGDPIPENFGRRGRPEHVPTVRNRNKIRLLLGLGWTNTRIAQALRITGPTLRKHYFRELRQRDEARPALEADRVMMVWEAAKGGNVGAMRELGRIIDRFELQRPEPAERAEEARPEKVGKKAAADLAARTAHEGSEWSDLLH